MSIRSRWSEMVYVIQEYWKKGYRISQIEHILGKWMCVFSKIEGAKEQKYKMSPTVKSLKEVFETEQKNGYSLIDLTEGW